MTLVGYLLWTAWIALYGALLYNAVRVWPDDTSGRVWLAALMIAAFCLVTSFMLVKVNGVALS